MNAKLTAAVFAALILSLALTSQGDPPIADPKSDTETIAEFRREVEELKQTVNALRARLNELEYQGLPQAPPPLARG
jgi:cell division protein FtsB